MGPHVPRLNLLFRFPFLLLLCVGPYRPGDRQTSYGASAQLGPFERTRPRTTQGFTQTYSFIFSAVSPVINVRRPSPGVSPRNTEAGAPRALSDTSKIENDLLGRPSNR